jgi:hypothetical protein
VTEIVTDYIEGRMSLRDRLRFRVHLRDCPGCLEFVRQMRIAARATPPLPPPELPSEVQDELLERFRAWRRGG